MPDQTDSKPIAPRSKDGRSLAAIIGVFGTVVAIAVSVTQVVASFVEMDIQNKKDEIEWSFKTAEFLIDNKDLILSDDPRDFEYFKMLVRASFPNMQAIKIFLSLAQETRDAQQYVEMMEESSKIDETLDPSQREVLSKQMQVPIEQNRLVVDPRQAAALKERVAAPTIFVAHDPRDNALAERVIAVLRERGYQLKTSEKRRSGEEIVIRVKYFNREDKGLADEVLTALRSALRGLQRLPLDIVFEPGRTEKRPRGVVEVVIG